LLAGLVRAVPVAVAGVLEDGSKVPFAVDQHLVGALGSCGAHPPFGVTVGPWCPRWGLDHPHALASEDPVEHVSELGVVVPDEEAEGADLVSEVGEQVAGLLGGPYAIRVGGHAEDVHVPGRHLHDEQDLQASEEDRVDLEEVAGQQPLRLGAQESPPGGARLRYLSRVLGRLRHGVAVSLHLAAAGSIGTEPARPGSALARFHALHSVTARHAAYRI
jgi:hypothetical protein